MEIVILYETLICDTSASRTLNTHKYYVAEGNHMPYSYRTFDDDSFERQPLLNEDQLAYKLRVSIYLLRVIMCDG